VKSERRGREGEEGLLSRKEVELHSACQLSSINQSIESNSQSIMKEQQDFKTDRCQPKQAQVK
jgi:hypothetical protein